VVDFFRDLREGKGGRFVKKAVAVQGEDGETELSERWVKETIESIAPYTEAAGISDTGKKVIAVDFDGVINSYTSGWKGPTETDEPVLSAAESLHTLYQRGYKIIIFSTRANTSEGADTIREYLRNHAENNEFAEAVEITDKKPIADVYIDDRAISFTGDWEETLKQIEEFKPWTEKSLTWSGYPLQGRTKVKGMDISIENKKGSVRSGTDKDGHEWHTHMNFDYGYIRGTVGKDKDYVDCYLGPNPESETVYVVHQNDPVTGKYDEDKVMLCFDSEAEAKAAYLKQYDRLGFLGDIDAMDIEIFKEKAFDKKNKGKMLAKSVSVDRAFSRRVYDFFTNENGVFTFEHCFGLMNIDGFPQGLDLENCEAIRIEPDKIYFSAGGDWQQSVNFAVELKGKKLRITHLYEEVGAQDKAVFSEMKKLIEVAGKSGE
jgi:hypothetical protein